MVDRSVRGICKKLGEKGHNRPGADSTRFKGARAERYLKELRRIGVPIVAREAANVTLEVVSRHRKADPVFAQQEQDAIDLHDASIEMEIHRRGVIGVKEPIYWDGKRVGWKTVYSDRMLELYAKRRMPVYTPRQEVSANLHHSGGVAVGLADLSKLSKDGRDLLRQLCEKEGNGASTATEPESQPESEQSPAEEAD